ncbi:MAG: hypothetical protein NT029_06865 [Armatimonadetes bacterium]|nr:hypothetical protein [Armatimonadota bacterium]
MTLTLPLTGEQEQRLTDEAARLHLTIEEYSLHRLFGAAATTLPSVRLSALGKYAHVGTSSEEFADRKLNERRHEERRKGETA